MKRPGWIQVPAGEAAATVVAASLGRTLVGASGTEFPVAGLRDPGDSGPLQLEFDDGSLLVFSLLPDGESVTASVAPIEFPAPEPGTDVWRRVALSEQPEWASLIGATVTRCDALSWKEDTLVGWRLWLGDHRVCFRNAGDNARVHVDRDEILPEAEFSWRTLATSEDAS